MVHHFGCIPECRPKYVLQVGKPKENEAVEFIDYEFVTDNDSTAEKVKKTEPFKRGDIFLITDEIAYAEQQKAKKSNVVSGARGTTREALNESWQENARLRAEIAKLKSEKQPA